MVEIIGHAFAAIIFSLTRNRLDAVLERSLVVAPDGGFDRGRVLEARAIERSQSSAVIQRPEEMNASQSGSDWTGKQAR